LRRLYRRRGFALVIVLLVGFVAAAIAASVLASASTTAVGAGASAEAEIARALALAGLERAEGYAAPLEDLSGDYDMVLDPGLAEAIAAPDASCTASACSCTASGSCNLPVYTDTGATTTTYNGKKYLVVPMNGGAYLTRFDDNADDLVADLSVDGLWAPATSNHSKDSAGGTTCTEKAGRDNPFRDRDRTIFVTVIGIAPGTNPVTAKHRAVYRETLTMQTPPVVNGIESLKDIDAGGGSTKLFMCSPRGTVAAGLNFKGGSNTRTCYCGDARADSVGSWKNCDASNNAASLCDSSAQCAAGSATTPSPATVTQVFVTAAAKVTGNADASSFAFNWNTPCNFFVGKGTAAAAATTTFVLWAWDADANRGPTGTRCGDMGVRAMPVPNPTDTATYGACWTPLVVIAGDGTCTDLWGTGEVDPATCAWQPLGTSRTTPAAVYNPGTAPDLTPTGVTFPYTLPDWSSCTFDYPGQSATTKCTTCDGSHVAMKTRGGVWFFDPSGFAAVIPGTYYYPGDLTLGAGTDFGTATAPTTLLTTLNLTQFPPATIVVENDMRVSSGPLWFGVGAARSTKSTPPTNGMSPRFASLIVGHDLTFDNAAGSAVTRVAGTMWVGNDFNWKEPNGTEHTFDGELHVNGNTKFDTGTFRWNYTQNLQGASDADLALVTAPVRAPSSE
jgi:hypothetical protein